MSVGKASIKRAAGAEAKNTEVKAVEAAVDAPVKAEATEKPVKTAAKKTTAKKTAAAPKKEPAKKAVPKKAAAAVKKVSASVVTPTDSKEIRRKFISQNPVEQADSSRPIRITEEMPVHLL